MKEEEEERMRRENLIMQREETNPDLDKIFKVTDALLHKLTPM